jgi:E3 ubiquitin-protein ligase BRE1
MLEYKREKSTLESRLNEFNRRATHHDDHLRIINAWWLQVSWS